MSWKNEIMVWKNRAPGGVGIGQPGVGIGGGVGGGLYALGQFVSNPVDIDSFDDFEHYQLTDALGQTELAAYSEGWSDAWNVAINALGLQAIEDFETYSTEDPISSPLDSGNGWDGQWEAEINVTGLQAIEDFENYTAEDPITAPLDSGNGWDGDWVIAPNDENYDDFETYATSADVSGATLEDGDGWSGPWVTETHYNSVANEVAITEQTFVGNPDKRLSLKAYQAARTMAIGSAWNKLRIGALLTFDQANATAKAFFHIGVMAGTTHLFKGFTVYTSPGGSTDAHALVAAGGGNNTLVDYHSTEEAVSFNNGEFAQLWEMIVERDGAGLGQVFTLMPDVARAAFCSNLSDRRQLILCEIEKGPEYVCRLLFPNNLSVVTNDVPESAYVTALKEPDIANAYLHLPGSQSDYTVAAASQEVNESAYGALDTIGFGWRHHPLEVSDIRYEVLA